MAATTSPALPTFSYAQAAKGLSPAPATAQSPNGLPSDTPEASSRSEIRTSSSPLQSSGPFSSNSNGSDRQRVADHPARSLPHSISDDDAGAPAAETVLENTQKFTAAIPASRAAEPKPSPNTIPSAEVGGEQVSMPEDGQTTDQNGVDEVKDKYFETSAASETAVQSIDAGNKEIEEECGATVPTTKVGKELRAAPMPAVNIWEQRKEAHQAKTRANAALRSPVSVAGRSKLKTQGQAPAAPEFSEFDQDIRRKDVGKVEHQGDGYSKKRADEARLRGDGKKVNRPSQMGGIESCDAAAFEAPPPVGDEESWPTPRLADHEDKRKSQHQDKVDKIDVKNSAVKPNQKWVHVPYVPTAKFNTPLPPTASRRGGRSARGNRDVGSRGAQMQQGIAQDKPDKMRSGEPFSAPPQTLERLRGRDPEALEQKSNRGLNQPQRASSVGASADDGCRLRSPITPERGSASESKRSHRGEIQNLSMAGHNGETIDPSRGTLSAPSRQLSSSSRTGTFASPRHAPGENHPHPFRILTGAERRSTNDGYEKPFDGSLRRERHDSHRDHPRNRDNELRSESWRDRDAAHERSEPRSGRGRGGYRGRGAHFGHGNSQSAQNHAFTAPLPQRSFSASKNHGHNPRHRQPSTAYGGMPPSSHQRSNSRSQSIPSHGMYPVSNSFPSMSPTQADMNAMYGAYPNMYPGVMSAIPYTPALEPMALISMVAAQLEYYFSIENLCKDVYLRSNMNSQGWVPLRVVAGFNRIKSLTEDMNLIRHVCQTSRNIEFEPAENGMDQVRKLERWDQWILDVEQRQPHARTDSPPSLPLQQSPSHANAAFTTSQVASPKTWTSGSFHVTYPDVSVVGPRGLGLDTRPTTSPTSTVLPDFPTGENFSLSNGRPTYDTEQTTDPVNRSNSPLQVPIAMPNGSTDPAAISECPTSPQEIGVENAFSNERLNELHVCVRHPPLQLQPPFMAAANRSFSHGSIDGTAPRAERVITPLPSLRGGAGSPESPDPTRERSTFLERSADDRSRGVFWMKDGAPPDSWDQEGSTAERYQSLHDRALAERIPGAVTDDTEWLYQFWSHFLVRNFNHDMYHDFYSIAWEDALAGYEGGLTRLGQYYGALLTGTRVLTEKLAEDIVRLADFDMEKNRQMFRSLRSAWRNGAFNLKSRKMIGKFLSSELKAALER